MMTRNRVRAGVAALAMLGLPAGYAQLNCNVGIEFHPNGGIARCAANGDHRFILDRLGAVTCRDGRPIALHPDGRLARCTLRVARVLAEQRCEAGTEVGFGADGAFTGCSPPPPAKAE